LQTAGELIHRVNGLARAFTMPQDDSGEGPS
jgi:hypothetical protein